MVDRSKQSDQTLRNFVIRDAFVCMRGTRNSPKPKILSGSIDFVLLKLFVRTIGKNFVTSNHSQPLATFVPLIATRVHPSRYQTPRCNIIYNKRRTSSTSGRPRVTCRLLSRLTLHGLARNRTIRSERNHKTVIRHQMEAETHNTGQHQPTAPLANLSRTELLPQGSSINIGCH